jgi:hypothetical protein
MKKGTCKTKQLTREQRAELKSLAALRDDAIDTSDAPEFLPHDLRCGVSNAHQSSAAQVRSAARKAELTLSGLRALTCDALRIPVLVSVRRCSSARRRTNRTESRKVAEWRARREGAQGLGNHDKVEITSLACRARDTT